MYTSITQTFFVLRSFDFCDAGKPQSKRGAEELHLGHQRRTRARRQSQIQESSGLQQLTVTAKVRHFFVTLGQCAMAGFAMPRSTPMAHRRRICLTLWPGFCSVVLSAEERAL